MPNQTPLPPLTKDSRKPTLGRLRWVRKARILFSSVRRTMFEAILIYHPHNEGVRTQLLNQLGQVLADSDKGKIQMANLQTGNYTFRVVGAISKPVDFTIRSKQHNINKSND